MIGHMSRASPSDPFGNNETIPLGGMDAGDPTLSPDGTELWFDSSLSGLWRATRACQ